MELGYVEVVVCDSGISLNIQFLTKLLIFNFLRHKYIVLTTLSPTLSRIITRDGFYFQPMQSTVEISLSPT